MESESLEQLLPDRVDASHKEVLNVQVKDSWKSVKTFSMFFPKEMSKMLAV